MATPIRQLRGTTAENLAKTYASGVVTVDETKKSIRVHDGATPGGSDIAVPLGGAAGQVLTKATGTDRDATWQSLPSSTKPGFQRARVVDTAGANLTGGYAAGAIVDGVTLAAGDIVLRAVTGGNPTNGVYVAPASGAATRAPAFATYADHAGALFVVQEGNGGADTMWLCTSNQNGTIGTTDIVIAPKDVPLATTGTTGVVELATAAEALLGQDADRALTPAANAALTRVVKVTLADDSATQIGMPGVGQVGMGMIATNSGSNSAVFVWQTVGTGGIGPIVEGSNGANIDWLSSAVVTGTTGIDGHLTIALNSTGTVLSVENRLGGSQIVTVILFGAG